MAGCRDLEADAAKEQEEGEQQEEPGWEVEYWEPIWRHALTQKLTSRQVQARLDDKESDP